MRFNARPTNYASLARARGKRAGHKSCGKREIKARERYSRGHLRAAKRSFICIEIIYFMKENDGGEGRGTETIGVLLKGSVVEE